MDPISMSALISLFPKREPPEKLYKLRRLSAEAGQDVIFKLRALTYDEVAQIKESSEDTEARIAFEGVVEPNFHNMDFAKKMGVATPIDAIKALLLPGEIEDISRNIERLSGYRENTMEAIEEVKKK